MEKILEYYKYEDLLDNYNPKFDSEEQRDLFYTLQETELKIKILDEDVIKEKHYTKMKYHVALTHKMKTLVIDFICPDELDINDLILDIVRNYQETIDLSKEDILNMLINEFDMKDVKEILRIVDVYEDIKKFITTSKLDIDTLIKYCDKYEGLY